MGKGETGGFGRVAINLTSHFMAACGPPMTECSSGMEHMSAALMLIRFSVL